MDRIVYLMGAGATRAEMQFHGIEHRLSMSDIDEAVLRMSSHEGGEYARLHDKFGIPPGIDIEVMMTMLEGCTSSEQTSYQPVSDELKRLFRAHLLSQIAARALQPAISSNLLNLHKTYGPQMGRSGEELAGILTINYDSVLEEAFRAVHGVINLGYPFESDTYNSDILVPRLLKLHGSFNWRTRAEDPPAQPRLLVYRKFEAAAHPDDYTGWMPPSLYKKPGGLFETIWDDAVGLLTECSTLRVIGSSLRDQDSALLSLIFTSRLKSMSRSGAGFSIELIVPDVDAVGADDNPRGIMRRLRFLGSMVNLSNLDVYSHDFIDTGNVYRDWLGMKIIEIERKTGTSLSQDDFLAQTLLQEASSEVHR